MKAGRVPGVLERIVPAGVHAAEIQDHGQVVVLRPEERGIVATAGAKRMRDFTLGRDCAHRALEQMGAGTDAILQDGHGAPMWPEGILGSITHTQGFAAAAVAPMTLLAGIGIDAERVQELTGPVASRIFGPDERSFLDGLAPDKRAAAATTLFSAKEACFKAGAFQAGAFRFHEVQLQLLDGIFLVHAAGRDFTGFWALSGSLVVTAFAMPRR